MLINKTQVHDFLRRNGMRVGEDIYDALDREVERLMFNMVERAKRNMRTTLLVQDL
jgi:hypothetical protein